MRQLALVLLFSFGFSVQAQECSLDDLDRLRDEVDCELNFLSSSCAGTVLSASAVVGAIKKTNLSPEDAAQAEQLEKTFQAMSKEWSQFRGEHQKILREYFKLLKDKKLNPNPEAYELGYKDLEPIWDELRKRVGPSKILDALKLKANSGHGRDVKVNDVIQNFGSDLFNKYLGLFSGRFRSVFVRIQGHLMADELFQSRIDFQQMLSKAFRQFADGAGERIARIRSGADFTDNRSGMKDIVKNVKRAGINLKPVRAGVKAAAAGGLVAAGALAEAGVVIDASSKIASCVKELNVTMTNAARFRLTEYARSRPLLLGKNKTSCDQVQLDLSILDAMRMGEFPETETKQLQSFLCAYRSYRQKGTQFQIKEVDSVAFHPTWGPTRKPADSATQADCEKITISIGDSRDQQTTLPWKNSDMDWNWNELSSNSRGCQQTIQQRLINNPTLPVYQRHNLFHPNLVCSYPQDECLVSVCRMSRFLQSHTEYRTIRSAYCQSLGKTSPTPVKGSAADVSSSPVK